MLWTIVRREITASILSFRFLMGLLIYFSLIVTNLFVLTRGYEDRLQSYRTAIRENEDKISQVKRYSEFGLTHMLKCDRNPKLLSIFNEGVDKRKGNTVTVAHGYVPAVAEHHGSDNPYLNIFSSIDFTVICQVVMSLLALLFSYDAISREKEAGTLGLTLSCAVPRPTLLLGKIHCWNNVYFSSASCEFCCRLIGDTILSLRLFQQFRLGTDIANLPPIDALCISLFSYRTLSFHSNGPTLYHSDVFNVRLGAFRAYCSEPNSFIGGARKSDTVRGTV